jgi:hypothetical protein
MLILDNSSEIAIAVDKNIPVNAKNLSKTLISAWPRLQNRVIYKNISIQEVDIQPDDIVVSAHACGTLTDLIIAKATEKLARIAVLPCCHDLRQSSTGGLEGWMDKTLAVDAIRAVELRAKGYKIITQNIPDEITPKNRLLMGEYKGDGN